MATSATIPVRLPPELLNALDGWAKSIGQSRSAAIKLCLAKQLGLVEKADAETLAALDGRHYRYGGINIASGTNSTAARGNIVQTNNYAATAATKEPKRSKGREKK